MATPAQIAANRRNALKSCGPKTPRGKAVSRLNALRHGAYAESPSLTSDGLAQIAHVRLLVAAEYPHAAPRHSDLLDQLAKAAWRLWNLNQREAGALQCPSRMPASSLFQLIRSRTAHEQRFFDLLRRANLEIGNEANLQFACLLGPLPPTTNVRNEPNPPRYNEKSPMPTAPAVRSPKLSL